MLGQMVVYLPKGRTELEIGTICGVRPLRAMHYGEVDEVASTRAVMVLDGTPWQMGLDIADLPAEGVEIPAVLRRLTYARSDAACLADELTRLPAELKPARESADDEDLLSHVSALRETLDKVVAAIHTLDRAMVALGLAISTDDDSWLRRQLDELNRGRRPLTNDGEVP